jgi:hypothetical protein
VTTTTMCCLERYYLLAMIISVKAGGQQQDNFPVIDANAFTEPQILQDLHLVAVACPINDVLSRLACLLESDAVAWLSLICVSYLIRYAAFVVAVLSSSRTMCDCRII